MQRVTWDWSIQIRFRDNGRQGTLHGKVDAPGTSTAESVLSQILENISSQNPGRFFEAWDFRATRKL